MSTLHRNLSISVFFPAFNDAETITSLVDDALAVLPALTDDYEVIVINDGSTDATPVVLTELALTRRHVKLIHHERNMGYGAALRSGFRGASKDLIFYTDGDGQYDVRELTVLRPLMTDATDIVNGFKIGRADEMSRRLLGGIYNRLARLLFRLPIRDVDCDFRLMRRSAIRQVELSSSSGAICVELVYKLHAAGRVFAEAPVHHYPRAHGRSQFFTFRRVARTVLDFSLLWWHLVVLRGHVTGSSAIRGRAQEAAQPREE
jgi:glycosyltransferase involved in cell wall biosynthesis